VKPFCPSSETVLPIKPFYLSNATLRRYVEAERGPKGAKVPKSKSDSKKSTPAKFSKK
jgi:hypothetical protein